MAAVIFQILDKKHISAVQIWPWASIKNKIKKKKIVVEGELIIYS